MRIEIIKDHICGLKKGMVTTVSNKDAKPFIKSGHAVECDEARYEKLKAKILANQETYRKEEAKKVEDRRKKLKKHQSTFERVHKWNGQAKPVKTKAKK